MCLGEAKKAVNVTKEQYFILVTVPLGTNAPTLL